jgi:glycosyltransferase involved in cell wall biosynthesis
MLVKLKIAYIIPNCSISGGLAVICQHANRLLKRGHSVYLLTINEPESIDWFPNQEVPIYNFNSLDLDVDILVATSWVTAYWLSHKKTGIKCYFVQSDESRFHPEGSRWYHLATLTYYMGVNYLTEARWIEKWLSDVFGHKSVLIPNGLDNKIFFPTTPVIPKGEKIRILLEGSISSPYKGMDVAFKAVENIDAEIWCVSSFGKPLPGWRCNKFFQNVPMDEMRNIYSSCDILLKLSTVEGFFGPPMEMMACGGVVVVGKVTGYDEYIIHGHNALVVDPLNAKEAESAIRKIITNPELFRSLIEAGRETAKNWKWENSIDKLENYYKELYFDSSNKYINNSRSKYDKSLNYFYTQLSGKILPEDIDSLTIKNPPPPHAVYLAARLASNSIFIAIANTIKITLNLFRNLKKILNSN